MSKYFYGSRIPLKHVHVLAVSVFPELHLDLAGQGSTASYYYYLQLTTYNLQLTTYYLLLTTDYYLRLLKTTTTTPTPTTTTTTTATT